MLVRALLMFALIAVEGAALAQGATPEQRLFAAIDDGKELVAEGVLLGGKVNPDARNAQGETALHRAVEKGMKELVRTMLKTRTSIPTAMIPEPIDEIRLNAST